MQTVVIPIFLLIACAVALCLGLLVLGRLFAPRRPSRVKQMPYESGMDPIHDTRRRFDVRFHLVAIAFLVFDVELLFLYPWAVVARPATSPAAEPLSAWGSTRRSRPGSVASRGLVFAGVMVFIALLALGFVYDWRKGIFRWR